MAGTILHGAGIISHNAADYIVSFKITVFDVNISDCTIVVVEKSHITVGRHAVQTFYCATTPIECATVAVYRSPRKEIAAVAVQFSLIGQDIAVDNYGTCYSRIKRIAFIRRVSIAHLVSKPVELAGSFDIVAVILSIILSRFKNTIYRMPASVALTETVVVVIASKLMLRWISCKHPAVFLHLVLGIGIAEVMVTYVALIVKRIAVVATGVRHSRMFCQLVGACAGRDYPFIVGILLVTILILEILLAVRSAVPVFIVAGSSGGRCHYLMVHHVVLRCLYLKLCVGTLQCQTVCRLIVYIAIIAVIIIISIKAFTITNSILQIASP